MTGGGHNLSALLQGLYEVLLDHFGHRGWWPATTAFEVCVGAILTQNTSWKNVEKAIQNLVNASALECRAIHEMPEAGLAELVTPARFANVKARRVKNFVRHVVDRHHGDLDAFLSQPRDVLREALLSINGVGKETADSIMLYAANEPVFVIDAYTRRILQRHGLIQGNEEYDVLRRLFETSLPPDPLLYNDFHAQIVAVGHTYCKRRPRCEPCPVASYHSPAVSAS